MNVYGQHMERLERQERCQHEWNPPRPYPGSAAGLLMRDCRKCWKLEVVEDGALAPADGDDRPA